MGILSAFLGNRSYEDNQIFHWIMFDDLEKNGYRPIQSHGIWDFNYELCWKIPDIELKKLLIFAKKYGQESVIYANNNILGFSECVYEV